MKKRFYLCLVVFLIALLAAGISLISCGGGGGGSSGVTSGSAGVGSVSVLLADSPTDEYQNIWLTITEVSLIPVNDGTPVVIFQSATGIKVDLLEYQDEDYLLAVRRDIPAGQYSKIRLKVSAIEVTPKDPNNPPPCTSLDIKLPSGKIDLNPRESFTINKGGNLSIRLDIDANKSINLHQAGKSGKCIFRPVVFVDIKEGMPIGRCPKVLHGTIETLVTNSGGQVVGFTLNLKNSQATVEVRLLENVAIVNALGECKAPGDLKVGDDVRVRGKLADDLVFEASNVVIGELLDVIGTVAVDPVINGSTFTFTFTPLVGQELVGSYTVQGQSCTLVLKGCDTSVNPGSIKAGMTVRVFGKLVSQNGVVTFRAAAIILQTWEIAGIITAITPHTGGQGVTIQQDGGTVDVFIPNAAPIYLEGDGVIPVSLLCVGREVRVLVNPNIPSPLTATQVKVKSERHEGTVTVINAYTRTLTVDFGGGVTETVNVSNGATILKRIGDIQSLISFEDIKVNYYVAYFGLPGCGTDTKFYASVVMVTD